MSFIVNILIKTAQMHAVCERPSRVSERAESRLFYVTVSEKNGGGAEMCDETEGGRGWNGEVGEERNRGGEGEKKLNQTQRTGCACAKVRRRI